MEWRRVTGILLAVFMVLANALPAMCGACPKSTVVNACAEKHAVVAADDDVAKSQSAVAAKCETCPGHFQLVSSKTSVEDVTVTQARGALIQCPVAMTENWFTGREYVGSQRYLIHLGDAGPLPHSDAVKIDAPQHPASAFANSSTVDPPEHSLPVVLKI
jgi:hypothetical protein